MGEPQQDLDIENGVLKGRNGELYLVGGDHSILRYIKGGALPFQTLRLLHDNIVRREALCHQFGARFLHLIAPEKYVVHADNFPVEAPGSMAQQFIAAGFSEACYPVEALRAAKGGRAYQRTDSHWSLYGIVEICALIAAAGGVAEAEVARVCAELPGKIQPDPGDMFIGDLGRKLEPQRGEPRLKLHHRYKHKKFENGIGHDYTRVVNDGRLILVESEEAATDKVLLIFGDSYLHHALDMLGLFFKRVLFARSRFFHDEMVVMARPDLVVTQMAERYLSNVRPDQDAAPYLLVPYLMDRSIAMTPETAEAFALALGGGRTPDFDLYKR